MDFDSVVSRQRHFVRESLLEEGGF